MKRKIVLDICANVVHGGNVAEPPLPECGGGGKIIGGCARTVILVGGPICAQFELVVEAAAVPGPVGFGGKLGTERPVVEIHCIVNQAVRPQDCKIAAFRIIGCRNEIPLPGGMKGGVGRSIVVKCLFRILFVPVRRRSVNLQIRYPTLAQQPVGRKCGTDKIVFLGVEGAGISIRVILVVKATYVAGQGGRKPDGRV